MTNLTRAQILARKTGKDTVTLPDGSTIAIRGLTHAEVIQSNDYTDLNDRTCYMVATAMTDPIMTFDDVLKWASGADAGDITVVSEAIAITSRLAEGAGKSGQPRVGERPGP